MDEADDLFMNKSVHRCVNKLGWIRVVCSRLKDLEERCVILIALMLYSNCVH